MILTKGESNRIRMTLAKIAGKAAGIAESGWSNQADRDGARQIEVMADGLLVELQQKEADCDAASWQGVET